MDLTWAATNDLSFQHRESGELALKAPEFLRQALAAAKVGTWRLDVSTGLVTWDEITSQILGLEPTPCTTAAHLPVHEDDRERLAETLKQSIQTGTPHHVEFRGLRADGEIRWLHSVANPIVGSAGAPTIVAGIVQDITVQKASNDALRESKRQLQTFIDNLPGVSYRCGLKAPWPMSFISEAVFALTGYTPDDFLRGAINFGTLIHARDRAKVDAAVQAAIDDRSQYQINYRLIHRSGEARWVHERGSAVYDEDGNAMFLEGFIGDVNDQVFAARQLKETAERYRLASRATKDLIWEWDIVNNQVTWNADLAKELRFTEVRDGTGNAKWNSHVHPADRKRVLRELEKVISQGADQYSTNYRFRRTDGTYAPILDRGYLIRDQAGRALRMVGAMQDLTEQERANAALSESVMFNRGVLNASADCIMIIGLDGTLRFLNDPGQRALEVEDFDKLKGKEWARLWPDRMTATVRAEVNKAKSGKAARFSGYCPTASGAPKWWDVVVTPMRDESGEVVRLLSISRDITESRRIAERLRWASEHDDLTQLPNRRAFEAHLQAATIRAMKDAASFGLLLIDLDHFKHVNDTLGHAAGDFLLKTLGQRIRKCLRAEDFVARLGGDEFAVILPSVDGEADISRVGESIMACFRRPVEFDGRITGAGASIGGALFPRDASCADEMLKSADTALYALKTSGRGGMKLFRSFMREQVESAAGQLNSARVAISQNRIVPFYQPKIDLASGRVVGFEALLRWKHSTVDFSLPATIGEAFNDYELASKIGEIMQLQVFADMSLWLDQDVDFGRVSINASPVEFLRDDYAERLLERMGQNSLSTDRLEVEVTEHVFFARGASFVKRALDLLHRAGVRISLDDFGTGSSSLSHLRDYPVDVVKIDKSFTAAMIDEPEIASIVSAVIDLARSLSIEVVAEGVETTDQAEMLRRKGCAIGQGFLFGPAIMPTDVAHIVESGVTGKFEFRLSN